EQHADLLQPAGQDRHDLRAISRQRLRHGLVDAAQPRPLRVELGVALIRANKRVRQRLPLRPCRRRSGKRNGERGGADAQPTFCTKSAPHEANVYDQKRRQVEIKPPPLPKNYSFSPPPPVDFMASWGRRSIP